MKFFVLGHRAAGHHISHARLLLEDDKTYGIVATREFLAALEKEYGPLPPERSVLVLEDEAVARAGFFGALRDVLAESGACANGCELFSTGLDDFWRPLLRSALLKRPLLPHGCAFSGIWIAANFHYLPRLHPRKLLSRFVLGRILRAGGNSAPKSRIFFFNEEVYDWARRAFPDRAESLFWCPDPPTHEDREFHPSRMPTEARMLPGEAMLLMAGRHGLRKGTVWATRAFRDWRGVPMHLVIAGDSTRCPTLEEDIRKLPPSIRVTRLNRWLADEELDALYDAATAVLLPYRHFGGSSGIFVNALDHGKPVVAPDYGLIACRVRALGCGSLYSHDSVESFRDAVAGVAENPSKYFDLSKASRFLANNSKQAYLKAIHERILP